MPKFSETSIERLATCHPDLQRLFHEVVKTFDCTVICGHRGEREQELAFLHGKSKARFGQSKHNTVPSRAVDVVPYPIDWQDIRRFYLFAGYVLKTAETLNIKVRWGGDWNGNLEVKDNNFNDLPHFEIV